MKKKRRRGTAIFNFTFLLYYHKILVGAQHQHSYLRNLIPVVIMLRLDLLICSCGEREESGGRSGGENNICFWILVFFSFSFPLPIRYRTQKLLNGANHQGGKGREECGE